MPREYKKFTVKISLPAKHDLAEIIKYIARNNPQHARSITDRIEARINSLDQFPERGALVPELLDRNVSDFRQLIESSWKIIYRIDNDTVHILAIVDSRRNLKDILIKKLVK